MYPRTLRTTLTVAALAFASPALAASVVIWPIDPVIEKGERATAIWVENKNTEPMKVQVRAFGWSSPGGEQRLFDQDEVVASPPIASVGPGQRQLIRVIRRTPGSGPAVGAYRLLIDELPSPPPPDRPPVAASLGVLMRYSIPLFTYNVETQSVRPKLEAKVDAEGRALILANAGEGHARLVDLRGPEEEEHEPTIAAGLVGYVLPGQTLRVPLSEAGAAASYFTVNVNGADQRLTPGV